MHNFELEDVSDREDSDIYPSLNRREKSDSISAGVKCLLQVGPVALSVGSLVAIRSLHTLPRSNTAILACFTCALHVPFRRYTVKYLESMRPFSASTRLATYSGQDMPRIQICQTAIVDAFFVVTQIFAAVNLSCAVEVLLLVTLSYPAALLLGGLLTRMRQQAAPPWLQVMGARLVLLSALLYYFISLPSKLAQPASYFYSDAWWSVLSLLSAAVTGISTKLCRPMTHTDAGKSDEDLASNSHSTDTDSDTKGDTINAKGYGWQALVQCLFSVPLSLLGCLMNTDPSPSDVIVSTSDFTAALPTLASATFLNLATATLTVLAITSLSRRSYRELGSIRVLAMALWLPVVYLLMMFPILPQQARATASTLELVVIAFSSFGIGMFLFGEWGEECENGRDDELIESLLFGGSPALQCMPCLRPYQRLLTIHMQQRQEDRNGYRENTRTQYSPVKIGGDTDETMSPLQTVRSNKALLSPDQTQHLRNESTDAALSPWQISRGREGEHDINRLHSTDIELGVVVLSRNKSNDKLSTTSTRVASKLAHVPLLTLSHRNQHHRVHKQSGDLTSFGNTDDIASFSSPQSHLDLDLLLFGMTPTDLSEPPESSHRATFKNLLSTKVAPSFSEDEHAVEEEAIIFTPTSTSFGQSCQMQDEYLASLPEETSAKEEDAVECLPLTANNLFQTGIRSSFGEAIALYTERALAGVAEEGDEVLDLDADGEGEDQLEPLPLSGTDQTRRDALLHRVEELLSVATGTSYHSQGSVTSVPWGMRIAQRNGYGSSIQSSAHGYTNGHLQAHPHSLAARQLETDASVVIDMGTYQTRVGLSNQLRPVAAFPSVVASLVQPETGKTRFMIGETARKFRPVRPYVSGKIEKWSEMEALWEHCFSEALGVDSSASRVLVSEAFQAPLAARERTIETLFELFNVEAAYLHVQSVLALFGTGLTTGCVVDSGEHSTTVFPVADGYHLTNTGLKLPYGGADFTTLLGRGIIDAGLGPKLGLSTQFSYLDTYHKQVSVVREIKERHCRVQPFLASTKYLAEQEPLQYCLPDGTALGLGLQPGTTITLERGLLDRAGDKFFRPDKMFDIAGNHDEAPLHDAVIKSINACAMDLRRSLFGSVVLTGGNTLFNGLPERLGTEIQRAVAAGTQGAVRVRRAGTTHDEVTNAVWRGGAVLTSLSTFEDRWILAGDYEEMGANCVHEFCPVFL